MTLSWNDLPQFIQQAAEETSNEDAGRVINSFLTTWEGYSPNTLQRVLVKGSGDDRVFALTALGLLGSSDDVTSFILPFLQSEDEREQWASAIALGRHKNEHVFLLLQDLLVKNLFDCDSFSLFDWQLYRRATIALLLGAWGQSQAIGALYHAFQVCWETEQQLDPAGGPGRRQDYMEWWHLFEDHLAYALGQLGAWETINTLKLPTNHRRVAIIFMALGSLHTNTRGLFTPLQVSEVFNQSRYHTSSLALFATHSNSPSFVKPELVAQILRERFGLSEIEQMQYIRDFARNYGIGRLEEDGYTLSDTSDEIIPF